MADFLGIPRRRLPLAVAMVLVLGVTLTWLQGRFDQSDVKKGIAMGLEHRPAGRGGKSVFEGLLELGRGDPRCDGKVISGLMGDVEVRCVLPGDQGTEYRFRVLLDGKRPPRPANPPAEQLFRQLQN
jgi:hypothetical protein